MTDSWLLCAHVRTHNSPTNGGSLGGLQAGRLLLCTPRRSRPTRENPSLPAALSLSLHDSDSRSGSSLSFILPGAVSHALHLPSLKSLLLMRFVSIRLLCSASSICRRNGTFLDTALYSLPQERQNLGTNSFCPRWVALLSSAAESSGDEPLPAGHTFKQFFLFILRILKCPFTELPPALGGAFSTPCLQLKENFCFFDCCFISPISAPTSLP